jgi:ABC-2 type transport system permease protein
MARVLELVSDVLPMTYAYDALARAAADDLGSRLALDVALIGGFVVLALVLGATTLRRRTA